LNDSGNNGKSTNLIGNIICMGSYSDGYLSFTSIGQFSLSTPTVNFGTQPSWSIESWVRRQRNNIEEYFFSEGSPGADRFILCGFFSQNWAALPFYGKN
jgi:hypothetical protein